jgi:hypothetical protein
VPSNSEPHILKNLSKTACQAPERFKPLIQSITNQTKQAASSLKNKHPQTAKQFSSIR